MIRWILLAGMLAAPVGAELVRIPGGIYTNLFVNEGSVTVRDFLLDRYPVTNAEFLDFVRAQPAWQRGQVKRLFADDAYLRHWHADLEPGPGAPANSPVVNVSWFAARAYAKWKGLRLPSLPEWELAARPDDATTVPLILAWYGRPVRGPLPAVGSTFANAQGIWDLHGLVWEWVNDFNTALITPVVNSVFAVLGLDKDGLGGTIGLPGDQVINLGLIIGAIITFLITAAVVYYVFVAPLVAAKKRYGKAEEAAATAEDLLAEIRDLLKEQNTPDGPR